MKQILLIALSAMTMVSCTKSVMQNDAGVNKEILTGKNSVDETSFSIGDGLDNVDLSVKADPVLTCESYRNGETPPPCVVHISFAFALSRPVNSYVRVELERNNEVKEQQDDEGNGSPSSTSDASVRIVVVIPPNVTNFLYNSNMTNSNTTNVGDKDFRIVNASLYTPVD